MADEQQQPTFQIPATTDKPVLTGDELEARWKAHANFRNQQTAQFGEARKQFHGMEDQLVAHLNGAIETAMLGARRAKMLETSLAALQTEHTSLQTQHAALSKTLEPMALEKDRLAKDNVSLRAQVGDLQTAHEAKVADLEKQIAEMSTHPDVIAAKEKSAADAKAKEIAALEKAQAETAAKIAKLKG